MQIAPIILVRIKKGIVLFGFSLAIAAGVWASISREAGLFPDQKLIPVPPPYDSDHTVLKEKVGRAFGIATLPATRIEGLEEMGKLHHANHNYSAAEVCWNLLQRAQPREARWLYLNADICKRRGDGEGYKTLLLAASKLTSNYAPLWLNIGGLALKTGDVALAEESYNRCLALLPCDAHASLGLARVLREKGRNSEAKSILEASLKKYPEYAFNHNVLADILSSAGDVAGANEERALGAGVGRFREALDPWLDDLRTYCYDYEQLLTMASIEVQSNRDAAAIGFLQRAIEISPRRPSAYELLSSILLKNGDSLQAKEVLENCFERATDRIVGRTAFVNLSTAYRNAHNLEKAIEVASRGLDVYKETVELHDAYGLALGEAGRLEESIDAFRRAIDLASGHADFRYHLAQVLGAKGNEAEAVAQLKEVLKISSSHIPALTLLCQVLLKDGMIDEVKESLFQLYALEPKSLEARKMLAYWHRCKGDERGAQGDLVGAEIDFRAGLSVWPDDIDLQARIGCLLFQLGNVAEALPCIQKWVTNRPDDIQAALLAGQCYARLRRFSEARESFTNARAYARSAGQDEVATLCDQALAKIPR